MILAATIWTSAALSMKQTATKSHDLIKSLFCLQTGWHCAMIKRCNVFIAYLQFQVEKTIADLCQTYHWKCYIDKPNYFEMTEKMYLRETRHALIARFGGWKDAIGLWSSLRKRRLH